MTIIKCDYCGYMHEVEDIPHRGKMQRLSLPVAHLSEDSKYFRTEEVDICNDCMTNVFNTLQAIKKGGDKT